MKPYHAITEKNPKRVRRCACCATKYGGLNGGVEGHRAGRKRARQDAKRIIKKSLED